MDYGAFGKALSDVLGEEKTVSFLTDFARMSYIESVAVVTRRKKEFFGARP